MIATGKYTSEQKRAIELRQDLTQASRLVKYVSSNVSKLIRNSIYGATVLDPYKTFTLLPNEC